MNPKINEIISLLKENSGNLDFYEFGTFKGGSLKNTINILEHLNIKINNINGFDSLVGLPEEKLDKKNQSDWFKSQFSLQDMSEEDYINFLNLKKIENYKKFNFFKGFYEDSLNEDIINKYELRPAKFINIDCDIYTSTKQVLKFIFKNKLYIPGVTLIRYDDWGGFYEKCNGYEEEFSMGEARAHMEITKEYNIETKRIATFSLGNNRFGNNGIEESWFLII